MAVARVCRALSPRLSRVLAFSAAVARVGARATQALPTAHCLSRAVTHLVPKLLDCGWAHPRDGGGQWQVCEGRTGLLLQQQLLLLLMMMM